MSQREPDLFITIPNFITFTRAALLKNTAKETNRAFLLDFLYANTLFSQPTGIRCANFYHTSVRLQFLGVIEFLQAQYRIDTERSKGNRTEQGNIEFNRALKTYISNINHILTNIPYTP